MSTQKGCVPVPNSSASTAGPAAAPVARSPLAPAGRPLVVDGWEYSDGATDGPVLVSDRSAIAKVQIRAATSDTLVRALGARFGRSAWSRGRLVVGSGPDEWLVLGAPGTGRELTAELEAVVREQSTGSATVLDLTHGRAMMRLSGPETMALLGRVTAVDLDDRLVPDGSALRTSVARVVTDLVRDDLDGQPSYLLHCERSSGRYLLDSLLAAGADFRAQLGAADGTVPE
jgi:heterotetrameric sarcosine oxidase gamma subunit